MASITIPGQKGTIPGPARGAAYCGSGLQGTKLFILWVPLRAKTVFRAQKGLKHWSDDSFFLTASSIRLTLLSGFAYEI